MMKPLFFLACFLAVFGDVEAQQYPALRDELLQMEKVDHARNKCTEATADEQIKCLAQISKTIDEPNT